MIINNLDVNRVASVPFEAQAIPVVDPDAVLPDAIAFQSLEAISGEGRKINQRARVVKKPQAAPRAPRDVGETRNRFAVEDCLDIASAETTNHSFAIMRAPPTLVNAPRSTSRD